MRQKQDIIEAREQTLRKANSLKRMKSESMRELNLRNLIRTEEKSMELKLRDKKFSFIRRVYYSIDTATTLSPSSKEKEAFNSTKPRDRTSTRN